MKIEEGWERVQKIIGLKVSDYVPEQYITQMRINKGRAGQLIEKAIDLPSNTRLKDFEDGDLKSYKAKSDGTPMETMAIHQLSHEEIDFMIERKPYEESLIHIKIERLIVLGICKEAQDPADWEIVCGHLVDCRIGTEWFLKLKDSYNQINDVFIQHLTSGDGMFHTSSGDYMQIRTKDSKPYNPRYSSILGRDVCNKRIAFYFQKTFMKEFIEK